MAFTEFTVFITTVKSFVVQVTSVNVIKLFLAKSTQLLVYFIIILTEVLPITASLQKKIFIRLVTSVNAITLSFFVTDATRKKTRVFVSAKLLLPSFRAMLKLIQLLCSSV